MELLLEKQRHTEDKLDKVIALMEMLSARVTTPDGHLTAKEAAVYLGIEYGTFRNWASRIKRQRTGRYKREDLDHFAANRKRK